MFKKLQQGALLATAVAMVLAGSVAFTQEKGKAKDEPKAKDPILREEKLQSLVRSGFTRPGNPTDKIGKNGEILPIAHDPEYQGPLIGATVYFAVFKGTGSDTEAFGKELGNLAGMFTEGRSFENSISPEFDRKAKYLYVYQIVSDRGLDPAKDSVRPAFTGDITTADLTNFGLRIMVDPRYITSWGHFKNMSFAGQVADRNVSKDGIIGAADERVIRPIAFSSNPALLEALPEHRFIERSPAYSLGDLNKGFGLGMSDLNLKQTAAVNLLERKAEAKAKLVNWEAGILEAAAKGGREPDYVQLMYDNYKDSQEPTLEGKNIGQTIFRVDFKKVNSLKLGEHSVVFGFTSDLPPTDEPIRIEGYMPKGAEKLEEIAFQEGEQFVALQQGVAPAVAVGTAPTPIGAPAAAAAAGFPAAAATGLGGFSGAGGGGGGGFGFPVGAIGGARAPSGGIGGGSGGGQGKGQDQATQDQKGEGNTINFNATLTNQQAQAQAQAQAQTQNQSGGGCCCCEVIPEPTAMLLGALGLPALVWLRRRNPRQEAAA